MNVRNYLMVTGIVGLVTATVFMLMGFHVLISLPVGLIGFLGLPKLALRLMGRSRRKKFTASFAGSIDVIVRGIKTGLPVGECLAIVGREAPEPVGEEFRLLVEGQKIGLSLEELLRRGLERMPTPEFKFFSIVMQISAQTGGNLAGTLEGLSEVLRERKKMKDKVQALSGEAKSSAMIIGCLPFLVSGCMYGMNPDYMSLLFTETIGNILLAAGLTWMTIGISVMTKMIHFDI
jgi:tight adherence protein B